MKKLLFAMVCIGICSVGANAAILVNEPFNVSGTMTVNPYNNWTSSSGSGAQLIVNAANGLLMGPSDRDYTRTYTAQAGNVYLGFDLAVPTLPATSNSYFTGLGDGNGLDARVFLVTNDGTNWGLGLSIASNTIGATTSLAFTEGVSFQRVVVRYNPSTDAIALWVTSFSEGTPTISTTGTDTSTTAGTVYVRQGDDLDNGAASYNVRNLIVSNDFASAVPEPSTSALLLGSAGLMLWTLRRKRAVQA